MASSQPYRSTIRNSKSGPSDQQLHFNYLRNNSSSVYNIFTWQGDSVAACPEACKIDARVKINVNAYYQDQFQQPASNYQNVNANQRPQSANIRDKRVSFEDNNIPMPYAKQNDKLNLSVAQTGLSQTRKTTVKHPQQKMVLHQTPKRDLTVAQEKIRQEQAQAKIENRRKVEEYVQSTKPFTRDFPNSKYQNYFGRAALQSYGRSNTNESAGGIIYGNHQKTFNVNPHCYTNQPKYYQSHTTALNFAKRTKLNEEERWTLLQKQLTKRLGLKDKNEHIKEGKQVVYVDVDESNMYEVMRQNFQFKKTHLDQIRQAQNQYKKEKQDEKKAKVQDFYASKQAKIQQGLQKTLNSTVTSGYTCERSEQDRIKQQVVYRFHDANGMERIAVDRHGITCYVDMSFPENDAAYTQELKNRMPIFPIECKPVDKNIDPIRRENYKKSLDNVYPSHYLLPNCQQPEILKMLNEKAGRAVQNQNLLEKRGSSQGKAINNKGQAKATGSSPVSNNILIKNSSQRNQLKKSSANTNNLINANQGRIQQGNSQYLMANQSFGVQGGNKSQLMSKAWNNSTVAENILNQEQKDCCGGQLPSNEKDPYNYRGFPAARIPVAGKNRN